MTVPVHPVSWTMFLLIKEAPSVLTILVGLENIYAEPLIRTICQ